MKNQLAYDPSGKIKPISRRQPPGHLKENQFKDLQYNMAAATGHINGSEWSPLKIPPHRGHCHCSGRESPTRISWGSGIKIAYSQSTTAAILSKLACMQDDIQFGPCHMVEDRFSIWREMRLSFEEGRDLCMVFFRGLEGSVMWIHWITESDGCRIEFQQRTRIRNSSKLRNAILQFNWYLAVGYIVPLWVQVWPFDQSNWRSAKPWGRECVPGSLGWLNAISDPAANFSRFQ